MNSEIAAYVKKKHNLLIGEHTAETIKLTIGNVWHADASESLEIRGRDMVSGLPQSVSISADEVESALHETMMEIIAAAKEVLEVTPPELSADIIDRGIMLTGGGALLRNIASLFSEHLKVPVVLAENPLDAVALGTGILLDNIEDKRAY